MPTQCWNVALSGIKKKRRLNRRNALKTLKWLPKWVTQLWTAWKQQAYPDKAGFQPGGQGMMHTTSCAPWISVAGSSTQPGAVSVGPGGHWAWLASPSTGLTLRLSAFPPKWGDPCYLRDSWQGWKKIGCNMWNICPITYATVLLGYDELIYLINKAKYIGSFINLLDVCTLEAFSGSSVLKSLPAMQETRVQSLGQENPPGLVNSNPLQYSCLENPMDRAAWQATVHGVAMSQARPNMHALCDCSSS